MDKPKRKFRFLIVEDEQISKALLVKTLLHYYDVQFYIADTSADAFKIAS